jgi:hypothetical protein
MVAGSNCGDQKGFWSPISHHQPMRELNDKV